MITTDTTQIQPSNVFITLAREEINERWRQLNWVSVFPGNLSALLLLKNARGCGRAEANATLVTEKNTINSVKRLDNHT